MYNLVFAHCGNVTCNTPEGVTKETIDSAGDVGEYPSITVGIVGFPVMAYYDDTNNQLKMAKCGDPTCQSSVINVIDSDGDVGKFNSITIAAAGNPVLAYYDATNDAMKNTKCANPFCANNWVRR